MSSGVRLAAATWVMGRAPNLRAQLTAASPGVGAGSDCRHRFSFSLQTSPMHIFLRKQTNQPRCIPVISRAFCDILQASQKQHRPPAACRGQTTSTAAEAGDQRGETKTDGYPLKCI